MAAPADQVLVSNAQDSVPCEPSVPSIAPSLTYSEDSASEDQEEPVQQPEPPRRRRASTRLIAQSAADIQRITGETTTELISRCCGGGCCMKLSKKKDDGLEYEDITLPDNDAFQSLCLKIGNIPTVLSNIAELPEQTTFLQPMRRTSSTPSPTDSAISLDSEVSNVARQVTQKLALENLDTSIQPPSFVQPHPPYHVFPAKIHNTRELTRPGAEKRTYHFDLDMTDYPDEGGLDFKVGGAIGVSAPNDAEMVEEVLDLLAIPRFLRDRPVLLKTTKGRWPTVWGDDQARELVTTRRDLLTWCSDIQSYAPTKSLLRVLAEHADDPTEKKVLMFLCSGEGQGVFCDLRTGPHVSVSQILHAFPDPHENFEIRDGKQHRLIEIAVTVHESTDWKKGCRTGVGSGFFERQSRKFTELQRSGDAAPQLYIPMFKGLMANPLAKQFISDGPMLLIGAGVGIAPFRGFVQRRLKNASCANKVWVLQGIRDSLVDEIYGGEWGVHESDVKRIVESRSGEGRYVQEEVLNQADLVWYVINSVDGRCFVCGSSKGMGEGVEEALVQVAMQKGNLEKEEARRFWDLKKEAGQYIAETW
ncbi:FAD binding domain protein [Apiospora arundinis]